MSALTTTVMPCPDPECVEGTIVIRNAYDPTQREKQPCDKCNGQGYVITERLLAN